MILLVMAAMLAQSTVPFVGCPADGQLGPQVAPKGSPVSTPLASSVAESLTLYGSKEAPKC